MVSDFGNSSKSNSISHNSESAEEEGSADAIFSGFDTTVGSGGAAAWTATGGGMSYRFIFSAFGGLSEIPCMTFCVGAWAGAWVGEVLVGAGTGVGAWVVGLNTHFSKGSFGLKTIICFISSSTWKFLEEHLTPCISKIVLISVLSVMDSGSTLFSFSS